MIKDKPSPFMILSSLRKWHNEHFPNIRPDPDPDNPIVAKPIRFDFPPWAVHPKYPGSNPRYIAMHELLSIVKVEDGLIHFPEPWGQDPVPLLPRD